jgi:myo-inositol 2-dehydrogenase/D-chiro-inositol 1-dehydrogenase
VEPRSSSRRDFIKTNSTAAAAAVVAGPSLSLDAGQLAEEAKARLSRGKPPIVRVAVVGTGGRGTGACENNLVSHPNTHLVALADIDKDKAEQRAALLKKKPFGDRVTATADDIYGGLEGIDKILARPDVDLVLLTTSPGFRPRHIQQAVAAKKHVFAEKPVCVDPEGYRICCEAHDQAVKQGTAIVTGTQYRRQTSFIDAIKKVHDGVIGKVVGMTGRYCSSGIWYRPRQAEMSDAKYQIHNWMHFVWLSGDQICEQAVHNIDAMNWVMGGPPEKCFGSGGRFFRPEDSEMWDAMSIDYEYPGQKLVSFKCRQWPRSAGSFDNIVYGEGGVAYIKAFSKGAVIVDSEGKQIHKAKGNIGAAYVQEHKELVDSILADKPIVELRQTAESSLTAAMGRMAAYTGRDVSWDFATKSKLDLFPKNLTLQSEIKSPGFAVPGKTKLI